MKNQIPIGTKERLVDAINTTKEFLNHEFLNYVRTVDSVNPSEWVWVTEPYLMIFKEKPNVPSELYSKLENLYTNVFQLEANKFMDMMRRFSQLGITVLKGDNAREFDLQYDKWRTDFTKEANKILDALNNETKKLERYNLDPYKKQVVKGEFNSVIASLIEEYNGFFEEQNILHGLSYRVKKLEQDNMQGIVSYSEERIEQSKIIHSLLKMIDGLLKK